MSANRPSLGRPARDWTLEDLAAKPGMGNSLTLFSQNALEDWAENIPPIGAMSRRDRRELICHLARTSYITPLEMMAVILLRQREQRAQNRKGSYAA